MGFLIAPLADGIIDSIDMSLSKLLEIVKDVITEVAEEKILNSHNTGGINTAKWHSF